MKNHTPYALRSKYQDRGLARRGILLSRSALAAALLATALPGFGIVFNDGGAHTISDASLINDPITVANNTTLNITPGAVIEGRVQVLDSSSLNISGGEFAPTSLSDSVRLFDTSTAVITGGTFGGTGSAGGTGGIYLFGDASLVIEGGNFGTTGTSSGSGFISPSGDSMVEVKGGNFGGPGSSTGSIQARGNSFIHITGGTFGTGSGTNCGIWTATDSATFDISGATLVPRTNGSVQSQTFTPDALFVFSGCEFSHAGTPYPFGIIPNLGQFRLDGTFANGETFNSLAYSTAGATFRLDFLPCDPIIFQTTYFTPPSTAAMVLYASFSDRRSDQLAWFEVVEPTTIGSIGGRFALSGQESRVLFGAVAEVGGDGQFPSPLDLTGSDVLGTTLLRVDPTPDTDGAMMCADLDLTLQPGWYVVIFGGGKFGADDLSLSTFTPRMPISSSGGPPTGVIVKNGVNPPTAIVQSEGPIFFVSTATGCPNTVLNLAPVADAGLDQTVECTGLLTSVELDGTASFDPDGDPLGYEWSVPDGASLDDPFSATPIGSFPDGPTLVTLTVTDGNGGVATDDVLIVVEDTTAPVVICTTDLIALLPPNHQVKPVTISVDVTEECSDVTLTCWVSSSEPDDANGDGSHIGDVDGQDGYSLPVPVDLEYDGAIGSFVGEVDLRAERDGSEAGRTYSIECEVTDMSGNVATASCVVVVPHDRRKPR